MIPCAALRPNHLDAGRAKSASDDLRNALVAQFENLGDGCHRQAVLVRIADGFVPIKSKLLLGFVKLGFAA